MAGLDPSSDRRAVLRQGGAAALGVTALVLPVAALASSEFGFAPLAAAGSMDAPTGLTATPRDEAVDLGWSGVSGATAYQVQYKASSSSTWLVAGTTGSTALTVEALTNGTSYDFRVIASDGTTNQVSAPSSTVSATPDLTAPATPVGLSVSPGAVGTELVVTWSAAGTGDPATSYEVRFSSNGGSTWTEVTGIAAITRTLTGLTENQQYLVQVRARNAAGASGWSDSVSGTPIASLSTTVAERTPQPPVEGAVTGPTSVVIETDRDVAPNGDRVYRYELSTDGTTFAAPVTASFVGDAATFTVTGLSASTTTLRVRKYASTDTGFATPLGTSTVVLTRRTPSYSAGQVYTITNATGQSRIGTMSATVIGGSGGVGGSDGSTPGGQPSQPGRVDATMTLAAGDAVTLAAGSGGANASGGNPGSGGTNAFNIGYAGGRGGFDGPEGTSGAGGGGGAASLVRITRSSVTTTAIVAGGAAAGGGGESNAGSGANGSSSATGGNSGTTNGGTGGQATGGDDDAAGGGGGGGGAEGGRGGPVVYVRETWFSIDRFRSDPAYRGTNALDGTIATGTQGFASGRANGASGAITLEYLEVTSLTNA